MILTHPSVTVEHALDKQYAYEVIERAGRTCYKSEDKITENSAEKFVKMILDREHLSVLEHISVSLRIICDRGVSHELVRPRYCNYRLVSLSQESNGKNNNVEFIIPEWLSNLKAGEYSLMDFGKFKQRRENGAREWFLSLLTSEQIYLEIIDKKISPQNARGVLPNALKTEIVMTANLREWLYIIKLRSSKFAHPDMVAIMIKINALLISLYPEIFNRNLA